MRILARLAFLPIALALCSAPSGSAPAPAQPDSGEPEAATGVEAKALARSRRQMVVAAHPLAAEAGREILNQGGTAMDAAVAVQMALNLVEPQSSGIGGGAFILYWDAKAGTLSAYDGRETAPAAARPKLFLKDDGTPMDRRIAARSGRAVGVPGLVRVLELAHEKHGRLPWIALFVPALTLASEGFPMPRRLAALLAHKRADAFDADARAYFYDADGKPLAAGTIIRNTALAETIRVIAAGGAQAFYEGPVAEAVAERVRSDHPAPGGMTAEDLARYEAKERPPVCFPYRAHRICSMGAPSSGGPTVAQVLKLLEPFDLSAGPADPAVLHLIAEAEKLAYADRRRYIADPDFVAVPAGLLDEGYLAARRSLIDHNKAMPLALPGTPPGAREGRRGRDGTREGAGTSHISIVDKDGNAVAMTTTIESAFGAQMMVKGFLLNNQLTDFAFRPVDEAGAPVANRVEGGKRPRSSMAPTIVFGPDGKVKAVLGSPGGTRIILYVVKSLLALIDWKMDAQAAASLFNFGSRNSGVTEIEPGPHAAKLALALEARGHRVLIAPMTSGIHIIAVREGGFEGGADPRREGVAAGD